MNVHQKVELKREVGQFIYVNVAIIYVLSIVHFFTAVKYLFILTCKGKLRATFSELIDFFSWSVS